MKIFKICLMILFIMLICLSVHAKENQGKAYYDFGIMAYEDKDYAEAEKMFKMALKFDANHPVYNYLLGKTYMKIKRYKEAKEFMSKAWKIDSSIKGLAYDLALANYKLEDYSWASGLFKKAAQSDSSNTNANYYAGLSLYKQKRYKEAARYFIIAVKKDELKAICSYYTGLCYLKQGKSKQAVSQFEYARENADSPELKKNALKLIYAVKRQKKASKAYSLYAKLSYKYDDNVRLEPLDEDKYSDEEDFVTQIFFSGKYNLIQKKPYKAGAGLSYYRTWHNDLDQYDLVAGIMNFYAKYEFKPFIFGFTYTPSKYWVDDQSYMARHQFKPDVMWMINKKFFSILSYSFHTSDYYTDDDKDGNTNEFFLNFYYNILNKKGRLSGGFGYEDNSADASNQSYGQFKTKIGYSYELPWELNMNLTGKYYSKEYDSSHTEYNIKRDDNKYSATLSFSRGFLYDWLSCSLEYDYTKNDSNIDEYTYERNTVTFSVIGTY